MKHDIKTVTEAFDVTGTYVSGGPYGTGHINHTYAVTFDQPVGPVR